MIIGDGDIATVLKEVDSDDLIFFASGVSNSQETRQSEFQRELDLLKEQNRGKRLVYFSSLSILYSQIDYARHKRFMEEAVKALFYDHTIIRLGNISWGTNPHTLINYLRANPNAEIQDVYRYVIDKDEFLHWMRMIPNWNIEMNCPGQMMKVKEIKDKYVLNT
jgi:hypothetical protein